MLLCLCPTRMLFFALSSCDRSCSVQDCNTITMTLAIAGCPSCVEVLFESDQKLALAPSGAAVDYWLVVPVGVQFGMTADSSSLMSQLHSHTTNNGLIILSNLNDADIGLSR